VVLYDYALGSNAVQNVMNGLYDFSSPTMAFEMSGSPMTVAWQEAGFKVQSCSSLTIAVWVDVQGGNSGMVVVPATNDVKFLRLIQQ